MNNPLYLVTGATGFLGGNVVGLLAARGMDVRALVRAGNPVAKRLPPQVGTVEGDLLDEASLDAFFRVPQGQAVVVIHCASVVALSPEPDPRVYDVNVVGTRNILDRCVKRRVQKLIYISSTSVIAERPHGQAIAEVDAFDPGLVTGYYAQTKAMATQLVLDAVRDEGLDASIVFPSGIFGPDDISHGLLTKFLVAAWRGRIPCGVKGTFNAVDVRDLAEGILACCALGQKGGGYIMGNDVVDLRTIFHAVSRYTGRPEIRLMLPLWVAKAAAVVCEAGAKLLRRRALLTRFLVYNLERNNMFSSEKARGALGYHTRPFEETITDTLDWLARERAIGTKK